MDYHNELTQEDFDIIVEDVPTFAAQYLNQHPFLTKDHVDYIVEKYPWGLLLTIFLTDFLKKILYG